MTKLLAFAALASLGLTAAATSAQSNTACYWENGKQICVNRNVAPRRNVDVRVNGNTGGAAVRVQGPAGTKVRVYR
ncbi:MAG: hypothetical protein VXA52_07655 [Synechococcus sp.]